MSAISNAYLGKPGAMRALPPPQRGFDASPSRSEAASLLLSGGTTVVRQLNPKRAFTLPYDVPASPDADLILGFYRGLYGYGPWCFVDPTARNMLTLDVSSCGVRAQAFHGWYASAGSLAVSGTAPTGVDSGVLAWTSLVAAATLQPGSAVNTADVNSAPVYLPGEAVMASLYAKASSAATVTLQLAGFNAAGAVNSTSITTTMSLGTSWTRYTVAAPAGAAGLASSVFVLPRLLLGGTVPTSVSIAGVQLEYGDAVTAWQSGFGSPRVTITDPPGRSIPAPGYRLHTLVLAEV